MRTPLGVRHLLPGVVASRVFHTLDYQMSTPPIMGDMNHNNMPKWWIVSRYFGRHNNFRNDGGSSPIPEVTPTWSSSLGPTWFGTSWSVARPHRTTPPWQRALKFAGRSGLKPVA